MISYLNIAQKWIKNIVSDDEVIIFKQKVFDVLPLWKNKKLML